MDPLIVDVYEGDEEREGSFDWSALVAAGPPWHGAIIKCTEGLSYAPGWFTTTWPAIRAAAGSRYGDDFFRGCYHYLRVSEDGAAQADFFLDHVERSGGWGAGDFLPVVDVEHAGNGGATAAQVIACTRAFVARVRARAGRGVILYGNSLPYDLGITDRMGCDYVWPARYAADLPAAVYQRIGFSRETLFAWQYCGDGESYLAGYPAVSPIGAVDISALTLAGGGGRALEAARSMGAAVSLALLALLVFGALLFTRFVA